MPDWLNTLLTLPTSDWTALGGFIAAGAASPIALQIIKHLRQHKWTNPTVMSRFLISLFSLFTACATYIIASPQLKLLPTLGKYFAIFLAIAHGWYWLTISPFYKWFVGILEDATKYRASTAPQSTAATVAVQQPERFAD